MKIFDYKSDGNTVIAKRGTDLTKLSNICYVKEMEDNPGWRLVYVYYPSIDCGTKLTYSSVYKTDEQIVAAVEREYPTPQEYARKILEQSENGEFIRDAQITLVNVFDAETAAKLREHKRLWKIEREKKEREQQEQRERENAIKLEQYRADETEKYNKFIAEMKRGGRVSIPTIWEYKSLYDYTGVNALLLLAREQGINVPLRTAGFVNNKVTGLLIKDGKLAGYYADGKSTAFWDYFVPVVESVIGGIA